MTLLGSCACSAKVPSPSFFPRAVGFTGGSLYSITVLPSIFTVTFRPRTMMYCVHHWLSFTGVSPKFANPYRLPVLIQSVWLTFIWHSIPALGNPFSWYVTSDTGELLANLTIPAPRQSG